MSIRDNFKNFYSKFFFSLNRQNENHVSLYEHFRFELVGKAKFLILMLIIMDCFEIRKNLV
ncbi:hypothetical protein LCGC14_1228710 [marine sediment metagenome]|uniref:Uncharacterized protein n=1 Tax=marine sediment metagenome TaxID=412755 RepID=A0A0F9NRG2_9ZZZZ